MATLISQINLNSISIPPPTPILKAILKSPILKISQKPTILQESISSLIKELIFSNSNKCLDEAYSLVLDHCANQNSLSLGKQVHTHVLKRNGAYDLVFLNTKLVFMYGKCGSLLNAEKVFDELSERSIFSYNAILGAYIANGDFQKAVELYADMRLSDVYVDPHTCTCVLKACAGVKDLCGGREIHGLAIKFGIIDNGILVNSLVSMYGKCDDLDSTALLFDRMTGKEDIVLWNLMISAYATNRMSEEALKIFVEMQNFNVIPSTYTFVAALQACNQLLVGMQIHAVIIKSSLCFDKYVANALVVMYSKFRRINEAARVFLDMDEKDNVSWNSMLAAYVQNGLYDESLEFFKEITRTGYQPDQVSVISVLSACGRSRNLLNGLEVHGFALKNRIDLDLQVGNTIIDMYAKCSKTTYMDSAFQRVPRKDYISWTTIIAGYVQNHCYLKAVQSFKQAQVEGIYIDTMMIGSVLLACRELNCISMAKEIHGYILRRELSDIVLLNTFVDVYGQCGEVNFARNIFRLIEDKNIVTWTSMIACYVHNGLGNEALELSFHMVKAGIELDSIALLSILSAAANLSALKKCKEIHGYFLRKCLHLEEFVASSLIDTYSSCGAINDSYKVFNYGRDKDLILWTSMINAYGMHGLGTKAIKLFREMEAKSIIPDHISFLVLLYACSHSALVEEGKFFFNVMKQKYDLEPWPEHYACLVDILGRANYLEEAFLLVKSMKIEPTAVVWCALLGACRTHSNIEIGEIAAKKLLEMDPENPGNYVLISNLYAAAGKWDDAEEMRMKMKLKGLTKEPACSWIEVENNVHTFISRDRSHPESDKIYEKLWWITEELERDGGYKTETNYVLHNVEEKEKVKMLHEHSERLAIAYGLLNMKKSVPIRVTKNLRVCGDCHTFTKLISKFSGREIIVRDANRFHHFRDGICSCGDFW